MSNRNKFSLSTGVSQKTWRWGGGTLLALAAAYALFSLNSDWTNGGTLMIKGTQMNYYGHNFINLSNGSFSNQGIVHFQGNIVNDGTMDCQGCPSGNQLLNNAGGNQQSISGNNPITWHGAELDNPGGLVLANELRIQNAFVFQQGMITTNRSNPDEFLHILDGGIVSNQSNDKHVDGYMGKTGSASFTFPVGDGTKLAPVGIEGNQPTDFFKAAYFSEDASLASFPSGAPFTRNATDTDISYVHGEEYWDVDGRALTQLTLYWDQTSNLASWVQSLDSVIVSGWDGSQWINLGQAAYTGNLSSGTLTSQYVVPDDYYAYTLAKENPQVFPVEWLDFQVERKGTDAELRWSTAREMNADFFEVQLSQDGQEFENRGSVMATGNSNQVETYAFTDQSIPSVASLFYRLRQVDQDGQFDFSDMVELKLAEDIMQFNMYPNPVQDQLNILIGRSTEELYQVSITNLAGQELYTRTYQGNHHVKIPVASWAEGNYIVSLKGVGKTLSKKLIVNR